MTRPFPESTKPNDFQRSPCPITNALDLLGDKWSLLIIRDLFLGKRTYGEFQRSPERIATNILATRLQRLEQAGIVDKRPYQTRPTRYEYALTEKGKDLAAVLKALKNWSEKHIPGVTQF